jgi:hypothetical protein
MDGLFNNVYQYARIFSIQRTDYSYIMNWKHLEGCCHYTGIFLEGSNKTTKSSVRVVEIDIFHLPNANQKHLPLNQLAHSHKHCALEWIFFSLSSSLKSLSCSLYSYFSTSFKYSLIFLPLENSIRCRLGCYSFKTDKNKVDKTK